MTTVEHVVGDEIVFPAGALPVRITRMQSMAARMWKPMLAMGLMVVVAALIIGAVNSAITADYFTSSKVVREAAPTDSTLATQKAFMESTVIWLPAMKFLGLGLLLAGITFLLATILGSLREGGGKVQQALGAEVKILRSPMTARMFPMFMMMGLMILLAALIVSIPTASIGYTYWNHSITTELNPAVEGSDLLHDLGLVNAIKVWLDPLKFVGMAFLFVGIGLALATIVRVLRWQSDRLWNLLS